MSTKQYLDYTGLQRLVENIDKKYAPIAALLFKGTVEDIAHLPAIADQKAGWMYNVTTGGGTTSDFIEGAGHVLGDGENVAAVEIMLGTFTPVSNVVATDDPKAKGWYEEDTEHAGQYILSQDRLPQAGKTYYTADTEMKWDILGGIFDLESKYLELGTDFPQTPPSRMVEGRAFLYLGDDKKVYTAVASPEGRPSENHYFEGVFTPADTTTVVNPSQVPLYVVDTDVAAKTKYVEVSPSGTENPSTEGWYEEDGLGGYQLTSDTTVDPGATGKKYYEKVDVYTYKRTTDQTVVSGTDYFTGAFVASTDTSVDENKVYYTEEALYKKGAIYTYNATTHEWIIQSGGGSDDMIPITNKEIDDLFI